MVTAGRTVGSAVKTGGHLLFHLRADTVIILLISGDMEAEEEASENRRWRSQTLQSPVAANSDVIPEADAEPVRAFRSTAAGPGFSFRVTGMCITATVRRP